MEPITLPSGKETFSRSEVVDLLEKAGLSVTPASSQDFDEHAALRKLERKTASQKLQEQDCGVKYGCFVDLSEGESPDGCVKDDGDDSACVHAPRHRSREGCPCWQAVDTHRKVAALLSHHP